jgi:arginyl-tRNA synthetase
MKVVDKTTIAEYLIENIKDFPIIGDLALENYIEIPPLEVNYTYAYPCYQLAKSRKKDPKLIAKNLETELTIPDYLDEIKAVGPYLNFRVKIEITIRNILDLSEKYGNIRGNKDSEKIVIEYPSPNTNKPLHLGHVRNMLIGITLSNLFKYKGHIVFQVNLNNDRGIHICKSMVAYKKWGNNAEPNKKSDHYVGDFYVKYSQMVQKDENLAEETKKILKLWEDEDPETRELWKKMNKWALNGFKETYAKFGIIFNKEYNESEFYWKGKELILKNLDKPNIIKQNDGAIVANLEDKGSLPDKILLRSDGTSIYITQDIYLAHLKKRDFDYDKSIYIVGNEQDLYFKQLFAVLGIIDFDIDKFKHLSYGMISLPEGKMKSREGTVVDADDILQEIEDLAFEEVDKRYPDLPGKEKLSRANIIGMSALRFFILKYNPKSDFVFNPKESLSFEGETGPYVQYCFARIQSIINKSREKIDIDINYELLLHEKEIKLIKQLNIFPEIVEVTLRIYGIHLIPQYLLTLCQHFNSFYSECQVISDNKELEKARLLLIKCVQIIIKIGLNLLGIETLDEM